MIGKDWYRYLAVTNQRIVEARDEIEREKDRTIGRLQEGRGTVGEAGRLPSLKDALQQLMARRERILRWVRTYPLPDIASEVPKDRPIQNRVDRIRRPAVEGLSADVFHMLHKSMVSIARMRMSIDATRNELRRSHRALRETDELLKRVCKDGF